MATVIESSHASLEQWVDKVYECCKYSFQHSQQTTFAAVKVLREKTVNTIAMTAPEEFGKLLKEMQETQKETQ